MTTDTATATASNRAVDLDAVLNEIVSDVLASGQRIGDYQRDLLRGYRRWSGADLRGEAKRWGAKYARSRYAAFDLVAAEAARRGYAVALVGGTAQEGPLRLAITGPFDRLAD